MSAIYILWLRELRRYVRSRSQMVASLGQPLLYLIALGFGLGPVFEKAGQGSYLVDFSHYEVMPANVQQQIMAGAKLEEEEEVHA